ncbi:N-carbamoyl-L-amino acid hydrolase [Variibacter gotjawalensis]|uniref:N-carbamoyl-L-amino acid hydrolase n=1 Tax=Variibacter gotjawalensis TaxID=1333996 RepID=A0A0S3PUH0_9BRAD|nr:M20 family metallo-hydrolase [Variibacter gotjawalensis]NIK49793.1 N-carbamoyl-L-amino-acid hydrolase [Variibacter gotjawalensis]RZS45797.1 N-carbamoyl-L-amino-acid hydrolase [Variibacter gotjawalensis]BAT59470.1 N-carbamoyl-L-amino acid hydrolase [Variibacter gotjawalensis]
MESIKVNRHRLRETFDQISAIGATKRGGVHRLALSDADWEARDLLKTWCDESGYTLRVDRMGSMFARRAGTDAGLAPVVIGSHLDSQPMAGRFDGPAGVLTALEVLRTLDDHDVATRHPIDLVNWTNEEGARFSPPLMASGVYAGIKELDFALGCTDVSGVSVSTELKRIGYAGAEPVGGPVAAYIELHIEQGTVLQDAGATIGAVSGVVGIRDTMVEIVGEDTHAGPLPMERRRDALVAAAEMILAARKIGLAHKPDARVTIGRLSVPSNSHSVVPGRVEMTLDIRHPEQAAIDLLQVELEANFRLIAGRSDVEVTFRPLWNYKAVAFDEALRSAIADASQTLGYKQLSLPSRAGHDAWNMARIAPSAMIFIPCRDGISHNEAEFASDEDIAAGADVLLAATRFADAKY